MIKLRNITCTTICLSLLLAVACSREEKMQPLQTGTAAVEATSAPETGDPDDASVALIYSGEAIAAGETFTVGVDLTVPAGWHTYWLNPGDTGLAPAIKWHLPEGIRFAKLDYPVPQVYEDDDIIAFGYEEKVRLLAIFATDSLPVESQFVLGADITWMICKDLCLPVQSTAEAAIDVTKRPAFEDTETAAWRTRLARNTPDWTVTATLQPTGKDLELRILPAIDPMSPAFNDWPELKVIPEKSGALDLSRPAVWKRDGQAWVAKLSLGFAPCKAGEEFNALLATGKAGDWTGWHISTTVLRVSQSQTPAPGIVAPDFTLPDVNGTEVSLSAQRGNFVVLEWINYDCPFVLKHYETGRLPELQKKLAAEGVVWLSICSSAPGKQGHYTTEVWKARMDEYQVAASFVLLDSSGKVGYLYNAKNTPYVALIDPEGKVLYIGGLDNQPGLDREIMDEAVNYIAQAFEEVKAGKSVSVPTAPPYGCSVKY